MRLGYDPSVRRLTEKDGEFSINSEKGKKERKNVRSRRKKGSEEGLREEEEVKKKHERESENI